MKSAARDVRNKLLPAVLGHDAILEINISSGKSKMVRQGRSLSGGGAS